MKFSFIVMKKKVESLSISRECREEVRRGSGQFHLFLAMEIHFISTNTSIAFDIFFIQ